MAKLFIVRHGQASFGEANYDRLSELGWRAQTDLEEGLRRAYAWYRDNMAGTT